MTIPLTPVQASRHTHAVEAPYRTFIAASLCMALGGGFMLATLLPLARTLKWDWGNGTRWPALVQAHGQLQLMGFAGLFIMGMALRLMPRFSGRPLAFARGIPLLMPAVVTSLVLRAISEPASDGMLRDIALLASAILLLIAGLCFAAIVGGTLLHRDSRAGQTAVFLLLGVTAYVVGALINLVQIVDVVRNGLAIAATSKQTGLVFMQQFGFAIMFVSGIGSRALPTFTGQRRHDIASPLAACLLAIGVTMFVGGSECVAYRGSSAAVARTADVGMIATGIAFVTFAWTSGALWPGPNRVAAASQTQFWFPRCAMVWMLVAAALSFWYAGRGFNDGRFPDSFQLDAIRHTLTGGVLTMMIVGFGMLVVPEFAGRRLQHPNERWLVLSLLATLNVAVALRVWPPIRGVEWVESSRYWPIAVAGMLSLAAVATFALMFAQSYIEQRRPRWASPEELMQRRVP